MELTDAIKSYVDEKVGTLTKFFDNVQNVDVTIGVTTNHHQKGDVYEAKINFEVPGDLLRAESVTDDLYKSINDAIDDLEREIKKYKEKMRDY